MIKKKQYLDVIIFILAGVIFLSLVFAVFKLNTNIDDERMAIENESELKVLSNKLAIVSDFLTSEVRDFSITLNPKHLRNYWTEVNAYKNRDKVINRLKELEIPIEEFKLLNLAKSNSDDLINTETRAMKLILRVYEVPDEQMEKNIRDYQLTYEDERLSFNDKVNRAREILYDQNYEDNKKKIMDPIAAFERTMSARVHKKSVEAKEKTNHSIFMLIVAIICTIAYLSFLVWLFLFKVSFPLKKYILNTENGITDAKRELVKSNVIGLIKDVVTKDVMTKE